MSEVKIAVRYAKALLAKANEDSISDKVNKDMHAFATICNESKDFNTLLKSPIVSAKDKTEAISKICKGFNPTTLAFFQMVSVKNRTEILENIANEYITIDNARNGIVEAKVTSSIELTKEHEDKIVRFIKENSKAKDVALEKVVDNNIIGGLIIRFGDYLLDNSIATQINNLKKEFNIA